MNRKYIIIGITCIFLLISGVFYSCAYQENTGSTLLVSGKEDALDQYSLISPVPTALITEEARKDNTIVEADDKTPEKLAVHICGAVKSPGVYETESETRVYDLIKLAGGLRKDAAGDYINQAQKVLDGQRIYIPTKEEIKEYSPLEYPPLENAQSAVDTQKTADGASSETGFVTDLININTATAETLKELPGVGETKASAIIEYRAANGSFQNISDLMKISGIKEGLFHKIEKYITVK